MHTVQVAVQRSYLYWHVVSTSDEGDQVGAVLQVLPKEAGEHSRHKHFPIQLTIIPTLSLTEVTLMAHYR